MVLLFNFIIDCLPHVILNPYEITVNKQITSFTRHLSWKWNWEIIVVMVDSTYTKSNFDFWKLGNRCWCTVLNLFLRIIIYTEWWHSLSRWSQKNVLWKLTLNMDEAEEEEGLNVFENECVHSVVRKSF